MDWYSPQSNVFLEPGHHGYAETESAWMETPYWDQAQPDPAEHYEDVHIQHENRDVQPEDNGVLPMKLCYGSIVKVPAKLCDVRQDHRRYTVPTAHPTMTFAVATQGKFYTLQYDGFVLGHLTKAFCEAVWPLRDQVELQAYMDGSAWRHEYKKWLASGHAEKAPTIEVEVNVLGSPANADEVGKALSKAGLYLQQPLFGTELPVFHYRNPQSIEFDGFVGRIEDTEDEPAAPVTLQPSSAHRNSSGGRTTQQSDADAVEDIMASLSHDSFLHELQTDGHLIQATLKPHQKKAMDFIRQRECGDLPDELSLWEQNDTDEVEPFFRHILTGAKRPTRVEARGGIVADEMGLGKSLVILSTIVGSLERARTFATKYSRAPDDETARKSFKPASRATLILAPSTLLIDSWVDEMRQHTFPGSLTFHKHLGQSRHEETELLFDKDIVLTTFATATSELARGNTALADINWFRIVLDEAHDVRNRSTKQFAAIHRLTAQHRWCLTGTPIQNNLDDLGALVTFLRVPILDRFLTFRKAIIYPTMSKGAHRFDNLRVLLQTICIRRTRELLGIPEPVPRTKILRFNDDERAEYDRLWATYREEIQRAVSRRRSKLSSTVLRRILDLRLFCNNGTRVVQTRPNGLPLDDDEAISYLQQQGENCCAYCNNLVYSITKARNTNGAVLMRSCTHLICHICRSSAVKAAEKCPICKQKEDDKAEIEDANVQATNDGGLSGNSDTYTYPTKLLALLGDLQNEPWRKSIVFSSWKRTLQLTGELLTSQGIKYHLIQGNVSLNKRLNLLKDFKSALSVNVLLMTLGTGAVGLNLSVASRIFILEPQWNPFVEAQAMARALRLGQEKKVHLIRYVMEGSIERSEILSRQQRKIYLAGGGFDTSKLQEMMAHFETVDDLDNSEPSDEEMVD